MTRGVAKDVSAARSIKGDRVSRAQCVASFTQSRSSARCQRNFSPDVRCCGTTQMASRCSCASIQRGSVARRVEQPAKFAPRDGSRRSAATTSRRTMNTRSGIGRKATKHRSGMARKKSPPTRISGTNHPSKGSGHTRTRIWSASRSTTMTQHYYIFLRPSEASVTGDRVASCSREQEGYSTVARLPDDPRPHSRWSASSAA